MRRSRVSDHDLFKNRIGAVIDAVRTAYSDYYCSELSCGRLITYVQYSRYHGMCYNCHKLSGCLCRKRKGSTKNL